MWNGHDFLPLVGRKCLWQFGNDRQLETDELVGIMDRVKSGRHEVPAGPFTIRSRETQTLMMPLQLELGC